MIRFRTAASVAAFLCLTSGGSSWAAEPGAPTPVSVVSPAAAKLEGDWVGALKIGDRKLALILHIKSARGKLTGAMDSPDQGAFGIPVSTLGQDGDKVSFTIAPISVSFLGSRAGGGDVVAGVFTQGGHDLPLTLTRKPAGSAAVKLLRPQEDAIAASPPPYRSETVTISNPSMPGVQLAGTLTKPTGPGRFPAAVLIAGSGRLGRDEEVFNHKVFLVLADNLTRKGMAVLRYDKRGVGQSTGDYKAATTVDFASDAEAAFHYLRLRPDIDGGKVGLIGHSEGGLIAPQVAARNPAVAFVVLLAGPGVPGADLLPEQDRLISLAMGEAPAKVASTYVMEKRVFAAVAGANDGPAAQAEARRIMSSADPKPPALDIDQMVEFAGQPWMRWFLSYDPAPTLRRVRAPILVLNGDKDLQVPAAIDLPPIRLALAANPDVTVIEMPGLNHLFQHTPSGSPAEYAKIDETLSPDLLATVDRWIGKRVK